MPKICYKPKRFRESSLQIIAIANDIIEDYAAQGFDLTLRQLYYKFVARDLIPNTEQSYKSLGSLISDARLAGLVDWEAIQDRTRNLQENVHWDSPHEIIQVYSDYYTVSRWDNQTYRPEVWVEKDAVVGIIEGVCSRLDVPYFACRGYTSQSEMWRAGRRIQTYYEWGQRPIIFHLGDHDPSGIDMTRDIRERLNLFCEDEVEVQRIALNMDQIERLQPPPNPAKVTDSRFDDYLRQYGSESWELDALEPSYIVELIEKSIGSIREVYEWEQTQKVQDTGRSQLKTIATKWESVLDNLD